jgi:hypothetical protein
MHKHEKPVKCEHKLEYCNHCDVVYCTKCRKEWEFVIHNFLTETDEIRKVMEPALCKSGLGWNTGNNTGL